MALDCCPKTFTGFCLTDNTPIALTLNNGYIISWTNLTTGAVTIGNPPAGTGLCDVSSVATVEIEPLTCDKDSVTICPGVEVIPVTATDLDVRNLLFLTDKVDVSGSVVEVSNDLGNPLPVTLDAATLTALETVTVLQGSTPWMVDDPHSNNRFKAGERITVAVQVSSAGDNTIVTPTVGARLRVMWIGMSSSEAGAETLTILKFGAGGAARYRWYMGAPGAFSHWEIIEGATNESLIVNLSIGSTVQVNVTYEEFV